MKSTVDERQRTEFYKAGNICFYFVWYALLLSILLQVIFWKAPARQIVAELAIFLLSGILMLALLISKGIWGIHSNTNKKTNLIASALTGIAIGGIIALMYDWTDPGNFMRHILWVLIFAVGAFVCCYLLITFAGYLIHKRQTNLIKKYDPED